MGPTTTTKHLDPAQDLIRAILSLVAGEMSYRPEALETIAKEYRTRITRADLSATEHLLINRLESVFHTLNQQVNRQQVQLNEQLLQLNRLVIAVEAVSAWVLGQQQPIIDEATTKLAAEAAALRTSTDALQGAINSRSNET